MSRAAKQLLIDRLHKEGKQIPEEHKKVAIEELRVLIFEEGWFVEDALDYVVDRYGRF